MSEWRVRDDPGDGWYQYRIYEGETLIANIPHRQGGREIAEQIVADHNGLAAARAEAARYREILESTADHLIGVRWYLQATHADRLVIDVDKAVRQIEEALAAGPADAGAGSGAEAQHDT